MIEYIEIIDILIIVFGSGFFSCFFIYITVSCFDRENNMIKALGIICIILGLLLSGTVIRKMQLSDSISNKRIEQIDEDYQIQDYDVL